MTPTKAEELAARLESGWCPIESPADMGRAAAELRRLAAVEAELAGAKKALALVQQHHATAWNRGHEAGMRASRDAVKSATDAVARDAWGNTQLTEALLAVEAERDALRADAERYRWLESRQGLTLRSEKQPNVWRRIDGTEFSATHSLAEGGTQHAPADSLDALIDAAMKGTK